MSPLSNITLRTAVAYLVISLFILFFVVSGTSRTVRLAQLEGEGWDGLEVTLDTDFISHGGNGHGNVDVEVIEEERFVLDDPTKRVIIVGDIHGMFDELQSLLSKVSYTPSNDTLIHVGDLIPKGTHEGSMKTLRWMTERNVTGVRGNHDERVMRMRERLVRREDDEEEKMDTEALKKTFPEHWKIANEMTEDQYEYLKSRPLKIHVPSAHVFIVHAGLLASDPRRGARARGQPLATLPRVSRSDAEDLTERRRRAQERAILRHVPQNTVPWNMLNMRGVKKNGKVTKDAKEGRAWGELWNADMEKCGGFKDLSQSLPCKPSTVIYGHAASRGLDIQRWTMGLDSGCVYGRKLTALVLGGVEGKKKSEIRFGDEGKGRLVSVKCKKPKE